MPKEPDNVVSLESVRNRKLAKNQEQQLFTLLARIDDLESALELLIDENITTRQELEALIARLEQAAAALDDS